MSGIRPGLKIGRVHDDRIELVSDLLIEQHPLFSPATAVRMKSSLWIVNPVHDRPRPEPIGNASCSLRERQKVEVALVQRDFETPTWRRQSQHPLAECRRQGTYPRSRIEQADAIGNPREQPRHVPANTDRRKDLSLSFPRFYRRGGLVTPLESGGVRQ